MGDNTAELFYATRIALYEDRSIAEIIESALGLEANGIRLRNLLDYPEFFTSDSREDYIATQLAAGLQFWRRDATEKEIEKAYDELRFRFSPLPPEKRNKLKEFYSQFPELRFEEPYETEELYLIVTKSLKRMNNGGDFITIESTEDYDKRIRAALKFFGVEGIDKIKVGWVLCGHYS